MRLSEDKISHLAHVVFDALLDEDRARLLAEDAKVRRELKQVITRQLKIEEEVDDRVRRKLASYSRKLLEGSPEWEVMYQKHFKEEMDKLGMS